MAEIKDGTRGVWLAGMAPEEGTAAAVLRGTPGAVDGVAGAALGAIAGAAEGVP